MSDHPLLPDARAMLRMLRHNIAAMKETKDAPSFVQVLVNFEAASEIIERLVVAMDGRATEVTGWIDGTIAVEVQPMGVPKPVGYGVCVAGKTVATLTPEAVEVAYKRFQELSEQRRHHEAVWSLGR